MCWHLRALRPILGLRIASPWTKLNAQLTRQAPPPPKPFLTCSFCLDLHISNRSAASSACKLICRTVIFWHWGKIKLQDTALSAVFHQRVTQFSQAWTRQPATTLHLSTALAAATALHPMLQMSTPAQTTTVAWAFAALMPAHTQLVNWDLAGPLVKLSLSRVECTASARATSEQSTIPTLLVLHTRANHLVMAQM